MQSVKFCITLTLHKRDICLFVTLVDHIMNEKLKSAHGRIGWCLGCQHAEADWDLGRSILWSRILLSQTRGLLKMWSFALGDSYLRNGASYTLDNI